MFCPFCGAETGKEAKFCNKCGKDLTTAGAHLSGSKVNHETMVGVAKGDSSVDSVEMVISVEKVKGKNGSKMRVAVFVDNISRGTVLNGENAAYKISPGRHRIKMGMNSVEIDIPQDTVLINLSYRWGPNIKPEIVCQQQHLVTAASIDDRSTVLMNAIVGVLIPLSGLILYIRQRKTYPKCAKAAGIGALVGVVVYSVIILINNF